MDVRAPKWLAAALLESCPPFTALFKLAIRLGAPRQRVGVLALVVSEDRVLVARHTFRPWVPFGLPGGWLEQGEEPEQALRRELREELGAQARGVVGRLLVAGQHAYGGEPTGVSLIYEYRLEGPLPTDLPFELLSLHWLPVERAVSVLRPIEAQALRVALNRPAPIGA